jgi:hypothetical protein
VPSFDIRVMLRIDADDGVTREAIMAALPDLLGGEQVVEGTQRVRDGRVETLGSAVIDEITIEPPDASEDALDRWRQGEHLSLLDLRGACHAAQREGTLADERKLAALVADGEARGER